jgi:hypothetical protein
MSPSTRFHDSTKHQGSRLCFRTWPITHVVRNMTLKQQRHILTFSHKPGSSAIHLRHHQADRIIGTSIKCTFTQNYYPDFLLWWKCWGKKLKVPFLQNVTWWNIQCNIQLYCLYQPGTA